MLEPADSPHPVEPEKRYPNVGVYSFGRGVFGKPPIDGVSTSARTLYRIRGGQLIYSRLFAFEGAYAIVGPEHDGAFVSNEFPVFDIDRDAVEPGYLGWFFRVPAVWKALAEKSVGMGDRRKRVKPEALLAHRVVLPSIDEQRWLVTQLDRVANLVTEAGTLQAEVDNELYDLIVATHLAAAQEPEEMSAFLDLMEDQVSVSAEIDYPQVGIRAYGAGMFVKPPVPGSDTTYRFFNRLHTNMLVLSQVKGWEGAIAVCDKELDGRFASPEYRTFTCRPGRLDPAYLRALATTPWFHKKLTELTRGQGARRERVRPELFLSMKLGMPKYHDQQRAALVFARGSEIRASHAEQRAEIDQLLPVLLRKTFGCALQSTEMLGERPAA